MTYIETITVVDGPDRAERFASATSHYPPLGEVDEGWVLEADRQAGSLLQRIQRTPTWIGVVDPTEDELALLWEATQIGIAVLVSVDSADQFARLLATRYVVTEERPEPPILVPLPEDNVHPYPND